MSKKQDINEIIGVKYGRLTIIKEVEPHIQPNGKKRRKFLCLCDCGNEKYFLIENLKDGGTKSCGCYAKEHPSRKTHGLIRTIEYRSWCDMKNRCYNINLSNYKDYGGRGIKVCDRWLESFENFLADMGHKPTHQHSIDRIDVNGNYEPSNCRWATMKEQCNNRRNNILIIHNNIKKPFSEWASDNNISYNLLYQRINRDKMSFENAIKK
jgi:hypothetical protein